MTIRKTIKIFNMQMLCCIIFVSINIIFILRFNINIFLSKIFKLQEYKNKDLVVILLFGFII